MYSTLALLALTVTAPNGADELTLRNVRATYGILGPERTSKSVVPGDSLYLTFAIDGITTDAEGRARYSVSTEVTDKAGKSHFRHAGRDLEALAPLGGNTLPAYAQVDIGLQQAPGDYTLTLTVTDLASKKSKTLNGPFKVLPPAFGIVRVNLTTDSDGLNPMGLMGVGDSLWVNFATVGFGRGANGQPNVALELRIYDREGQPTTEKPMTGVVNKDVSAKSPALPVQFHLALNRAGKFTVELKATDETSGKSTVQRFPLTVFANP